MYAYSRALNVIILEKQLLKLFSLYNLLLPLDSALLISLVFCWQYAGPKLGSLKAGK